MSSRSLLLSAGLVLATGAWLASGYLTRDADGAVNEAAPAETPAPEPMRVGVLTLADEMITRELSVQGQAEPSRIAELTVETDGQIAKLLAERGDRVREGQALVELAMDDREARLERARALVEQRTEELTAAETLRARGLQASVESTRARAELASAKAELAAAQLDIARTVIRAPFDGVLESRDVELGEAVRAGDALLSIVDMNPLVVSGQVPQNAVGQLDRNAPARVILATGEEVDGHIRYIARTSDPQTRTFRVEIELPNADGRLPAGVSAELRFPIETVQTHFISPALLSLDADGVLGVKTVNSDDQVAFHPVSIVRSGGKGVWVSGLPQSPRVISAGQGFVAAGETVIPEPGKDG